MACEPYERAWRFIAVAGESGCWIWGGGTSGSKGRRPSFRPTTSASDPNVYVHRWMWERENGPVPEGLELDHFVCQNRMCVNPAHLEPVTPEENSRRARLLVCKAGLHDLADPAACNWDVRGRRRGCIECGRIRSREYQRALSRQRQAAA